jgi:hypothetical protein
MQFTRWRRAPELDRGDHRVPVVQRGADLALRPGALDEPRLADARVEQHIFELEEVGVNGLPCRNLWSTM